MSLRVRVVQRIVFTKKDTSLEELVPEMDLGAEIKVDDIYPSELHENGFTEVELVRPTVPPKPFSEGLRVRVVNHEVQEGGSLDQILKKVGTLRKVTPLEKLATPEVHWSGFEVVKMLVPAVKEVAHLDDDAALGDIDDEDYEGSGASTVQPGETTTPPLKRLLGEIQHSSRIEPMFEVRDEIFFRPPPPLPRHVVEHGRFETSVLEEELMIKAPNLDLDVLRKMLKNASYLEEAKEGGYRDYGSSYILPVLLSVDYDNNTAPTAFVDIPVLVSVQMNILYLANFDSELMEYSLDVELDMSWHDLRLVNNYTKPIRIREKSVLDLIWKPDPYFVNSKTSHFHQVSFPNFRMRVFPDGLVKYTVRVSSVCNCFMLFCLYPHDRQSCDLRISSIAYPEAFVRFVWHSEPVLFQSEIALPELHIQQIRTEECVVEGKLIRSSCLRLVFDLERDGGRFIAEKYMPSTLAMMFAWVAPYVPYNYEEVRIITPITVLLTLVQMEKGDKEIRTSYLTSMDVWFAAMKAFTALSLFESLVVLSLIKQSRAVERSVPRAVNELQKANLLSERNRLRRFYHRMDTTSRFLSPIFFVVFFFYYVLFVAQGDDRGCVAK